MSVKYGIIGAMDPEVTSLQESLTDPKSEIIADMKFVSGRLGQTEAVIVKCGMGKVNAGICAHTLIQKYGCTKIINTGVAGSLDNRIDIGDIVVSTEAVQHDFDVSVIGFQKGEIPYTGLVAFPSDSALHDEAVKAVKATASEINVFEGRVCSGDQFIASSEQKNKILETFGGLCCEMEGGAIAQVCYLNHTPYVILRAISDKADHSEEMSFEQFAETAAKRCAAIVHVMVKG